MTLRSLVKDDFPAIKEVASYVIGAGSSEVNWTNDLNSQVMADLTQVRVFTFHDDSLHAFVVGLDKNQKPTVVRVSYDTENSEEGLPLSYVNPGKEV